MDGRTSYHSFFFHIKFLLAIICTSELAVIVLYALFRVENPLTACHYMNISLDDFSLHGIIEDERKTVKENYRNANDNYFYHYHFSTIGAYSKHNNDTSPRKRTTGNAVRISPFKKFNENTFNFSQASLDVGNNIRSQSSRSLNVYEKEKYAKDKNEYENADNSNKNNLNLRHIIHRVHKKYPIINQSKFENSIKYGSNNRTYLFYTNPILNHLRNSKKLSQKYNFLHKHDGHNDARFLGNDRGRVCSPYALFICFVVFHAICDFTTLVLLLLEHDKLVLSLLLTLVVNVAISTLFLISGCVAFIFISDAYNQNDYYFIIFLSGQAVLRIYEMLCVRKLYWYHQFSTDTGSRPHRSLLRDTRTAEISDEEKGITLLSDADTVELEESLQLSEF